VRRTISSWNWGRVWSKTTAPPQRHVGGSGTRAEGDGVPGHFGFIGKEAPADMEKLYVGTRVPDEYRKRSAANPIKYTWIRRSRPITERQEPPNKPMQRTAFGRR
jgi:hypothetical protein